VRLSTSAIATRDLMNTRFRGGKISNLNSSNMDYASTTVGLGASTGLHLKKSVA
jgi:hypothetical protein